MTETYKQLFGLLRSVLNGEQTVEAVLTPVIIAEARHQTVDGLLFSLQNVSWDNYPMAERMKWLARQPYLINANQRMNDNVAGLAKTLEAAGIRYAVMKGQTCGAFYPNAQLRCPGDIDVYIAERDFDRANALLADKGFTMTDRTMLHTTWQRGGLDIELHWAVQKMQWPGAYNRLREFTRAEVDNNDAVRTQRIGGHEVAVLPYELNMVLLTVHAFNHVVSGGLGLRQVIDWMMVLRATVPYINKEKLYGYLKELRMLRMWRVLSYICSTYLGMDVAISVLSNEGQFTKKEKQISERLLKWVMKAGNFGHDLELGDGAERFVRYYALFLANCARFFWISPTEMMSYPIAKAYRGITGKNHKKTK